MMDKNAKIASEDSLKEIPLLKNLLNHYQSLCESHDSEMLDMLEVLDKTRINWKTATLDCLRLRAMLESLERENKNIITELRSTQEKLREGQAKNAALDSTNRDLAVEIEQYKRMFDTVKAILKEDCGKYPVKEKLMELPFFTDKRSMPQPGGTPASSREPSLATTDDIDYDKTGDSFADAVEEQVSEGGSSNARYGRANPRRSNRLKQQTNHRSSKTTKRRSASQQPLRPNGNKFSEVVITEEEENASDAPCPTPSKRRYEKAYVQPKTISSCKPSVAVRSSMNRSFSESNILDERRNPQSARVGNAAGSTIDIRSPLVGFGNCWTKGQKISECGHNFVLTRSLFSGTCNVCLKGWAMCLTSKTLKCQDCELVIHERCRALAPLPCIPFVHTPQKQKQARPRLADYCPNTRPQIPALLIRCVVQIEKGYLTKEGIYRTPGTMSEVNRLMDAFSSRFVPNLNNYDPDEALIPTSSYKEFVRAAESGNKEQLIELVNGLPIPNRDTLAYMCAHLQKIASESSINKMPLENLAACIGPTIVGPNLSVKKGAVQTGDVLEETGEMRRKNTVLLELLKLDNEFWTNFTNYPVNDGVSTPHAVNRTPAAAAASSTRRNVRPREFDADKSFLGPVTKTPPHHGGGGLLVQPIRTTNKLYFNRPY